MSRELIAEEPFEVDARVAIQLGRESISSSLVAILELVKNAYDADAENVTIKFLNINYTNQNSDLNKIDDTNDNKICYDY